VNREEALALLDRHCPADSSWRAHCFQVCNAAFLLAERFSQRGHSVDIEQAAVLGLLHDLGRSRGHNLCHGVEGYLLAQAAGHQEAGRICLIHILKGRTLAEGVKLGMLTPEEQLHLEESGWLPGDPSLEEKIVIVADALMSDTGLVSIEEKYANSRRRYGGLPHHYQDEAWVKELAGEIAQVLAEDPHQVLQEAKNDLL
jgi:hypothetical protein